jgi:hypothetical protein
MLPRLEAQRELADISAMSVAFGGMRSEDRRRHLGQLRRIAMGGPGGVLKATPQSLAAMGIAVVIVPAEGTADG